MDPQPSFAGEGWDADRRMRLVEVLLVMTIAFGGSLINSSYYFLYDITESPVRGPDEAKWDWWIRLVRELSMLWLLWYVLLRRGRTISSLGVTRKASDIAQAVVLVVLAWVAYYTYFYLLSLAGLVPADPRGTLTRAENILFGAGVSYITIVFALVNPFFEELIVRGFLMTEIKALTRSAVLAVVISTALQTSYHFYQGAQLAMGHAVTFLVFSVFYARTNRLTPVILAHMFMDVSGVLHYMHRH